MHYVGGTSSFGGETGSGLNSIPDCCSAYQGPFPIMVYSVTEVGRSYVLLPSASSLNVGCWCYIVLPRAKKPDLLLSGWSVLLDFKGWVVSTENMFAAGRDVQCCSSQEPL